MRILAHLSEDPGSGQAFQPGRGHPLAHRAGSFRRVAAGADAEHRRVAKAINFGVIYGLSPFGLAPHLGIDTKEAAHFIEQYFERYTGVKEYLENQIDQTRKIGYTKTFSAHPSHARNHVPQVNLRNFAERTAMNTPMQGTAADLIKLAMIEADRRLAGAIRSENDSPGPRRIALRGPAGRTRPPRKVVRKEMEGVHDLAVPLVADLKAGPNWRDMK